MTHTHTHPVVVQSRSFKKIGFTLITKSVEAPSDPRITLKEKQFIHDVGLYQSSGVLVYRDIKQGCAALLLRKSMYHLVSGGQQQNKLPHSVSQHPMKKIFSKQPPGADMVQNTSEGGERKNKNLRTKRCCLDFDFRWNKTRR